MSAAALGLRGKYSILQVEFPGGDLTPVGVLLEDIQARKLYVRLRRDLGQLAEAQEAEVFEALEDDLAAKADSSDLGTEGLFRYLEDGLSNVLRVTDRELIEVENFDRALNRLYRQNVQSNVVPFRTHLPLYSLRVAAGKFLENEKVAEQDWLETPKDMKLSPEMFVAHIVGHSMEPAIPDGALCVFRGGVVAGSRQGRLVLVENLETSGNNRYTVKQYESFKEQAEEGWKHARIRLRSLNPEYPSWDLDPEEAKYRIMGEFVRVLE